MFETLIVQPIFNALMLLYSIIPGGDFGIAIILFTIIIRFALYPLVRSQLHQTKLMRKMQPELAKIKQASGGNKQLEAAQQMELYKRFGIKPFRSILILLIQLPIFIGLYQVIQVVTLHRDQVVHFMYAPVQSVPAIKAVIENPDNFNHTMLGFIDLTKTAFSNGSVNFALLALALISAITQYIMSKQTMPTTATPKKFRQIMAEAAEGKKSDPSDMTNAMTGGMLKFMPVMMFFIMVGLPGALALYYTASNLVATAQQHYLLNKDTHEMDELADEVIDAQASKKAKGKKKASEREKKATEGHVTRITAKDTRKR
ncbi:MAG: membrane protein insertase YidC [Candidatus Saccharimonas sp.]